MNFRTLNRLLRSKSWRLFVFAGLLLTDSPAVAEVGLYPWAELNNPVAGHRYVYTGTARNESARTTEPVERVLTYTAAQSGADGLRFDLTDRVISTANAANVYYDYQESHLFNANTGEQLLARVAKLPDILGNGNTLNLNYAVGSLAPSLFTQGQTYTYSTTFNLGSNRGSERRRVTVLPLETVTVPAGTFRCVRINLAVDYPSSGGLGLVATGATYWYARNVGVVKATVVQVPTLYSMELNLQSTNFPLEPGVFEESFRIVAEPESVAVAVGDPARLRVIAEGPNLGYAWTFNGNPIPGATGATLTLPAATFASSGAYRVKVSGPSGSIDSKQVFVAVARAATGSPGKLFNVSVRAYGRNGAQTLIAGLAMQGNLAPHRVLVRAIGPSLRQFTSDPVCPDPSLSMRNNSSVSIGENDDWSATGDPTVMATAAQRVGAFPLLVGSRDAAQLIPLSAGNYTALSSDAVGGTALVECYDLDSGQPGGFGNLSARADTRLAPLIVGWVILGPDPVKVLIRSVGPSLAQFGLSDLAVNPRIDVFSGFSSPASNNAWSNSAQLAELRAAFKAVGAFDLLENSWDCALIATLSPGAYSAVVNQSPSGGVTLIEIYRLP